MAGDILQFSEFFVSDDSLTYDEAAWEKRVAKDAAAVDLLQKYLPLMQACETWEADSIESQLKGWLEQNGAKIGQIVHILRLAATGKSVGAGLFETLEILGKDRVLRRVERLLDRLSASST